MSARAQKRRIPSAQTLVDADESPDVGMVGRVAGAELRQAVSMMDFPPLVAWNRDGTIQLANHAASEMSGYSIDELVDMPLVEFAGPAAEIRRVLADLTSGRFYEVHTNRTVRAKSGESHAVYAASRSIEVDGLPGGVSVFMPAADDGRLRPGSERSWLDLVPVAVGFTDGDWNVRAVSAEVEDLIDRTAEELKGRCLLDLVDPADVGRMRGTDHHEADPRSVPRVHFLLPTGGSTEVCVVVAPRLEPPGGIRFAMVGRIESFYPPQRDRVAELELRLRRIGAEVRAAGLLDTAGMPALQHPELGQLSSRQWEVISRLLDGKRVPTIAKELFVSQSTVRNHLATIFQRFGVHSQAELLERLRQPDST